MGRVVEVVGKRMRWHSMEVVERPRRKIQRMPLQTTTGDVVEGGHNAAGDNGVDGMVV
jgi:hypothetical protein